MRLWVAWRTRVLIWLTLGVVQGVVLPLSSAFAGQGEFYDPVCKNFVKENKFTSGDYTYWENKVLPAYEKIMASPELENEAKYNANYKQILSNYGFREGEVGRYNKQRIVTDCASRPGGKECFALQTYCVQNFVDKQLPYAVEKTLGCLKPWNQPYCGDSFQTIEGIESNRNTLIRVNDRFNKAYAKANQKPFVPEYLYDNKQAMEEYSAQVQKLIKESNLSIEEAKKKAAEKAKSEYEKQQKQVDNLGAASKVFNQCRTYLKNEGHVDSRSLVDQVSPCAVNVPIPPAEAESFKKIIKGIQAADKSARNPEVADLVKQIYQESVSSSARQFLESSVSINGKVPTQETFCSKMGGCDASLKQVYQEVKDREAQIPRMNFAQNASDFNAKVSALNAACKAAQKSVNETPGGNGAGYVARINEAYSDLMYKTAYGNLMSIGKFQDVAGKFDQEDCLEDGEGLKAINPNDPNVKKSLESAANVVADKVRELKSQRSSLLDPKDPNAGLRYFLEYDPLTVRELARKTQNPRLASLMCSEIDRVYKKEKNQRVVSGVLMGLAIVGGIAATILTFGAAAPGLVAIGVGMGYATTVIGVGGGVYGLYNAKKNENRYQQSVQTGTFDTEIGQNLVNQYHTQAKAEVVGIAASFVPGAGRLVGKGLTSAAVKTGVMESVQLSKSTLMTAVRSAPAWKTSAKLLAPAEQFLAKAKAGSAVTLGEMQIALATKVGPKTNQIMVQSFNSFTKEMTEDVALTFGTHALTHPDPYSEEGILDCLKSIAMSRGLAAIGKGGGAYLSSKRPDWKFNSPVDLGAPKPLALPPSTQKGMKTTERATLSPVMQDALHLPQEKMSYREYFDMDKRLANSTDPRKSRLLEVQKTAYDDFAKEVYPKFNKPGELDQLQRQMHKVHETCCIDPVTMKPVGEKVLELQALKSKLIEKGFSKQEAFQRIDGISNKDVMLLGNPGPDLQQLAKMKDPKEVKTWIEAADPKDLESRLQSMIEQRNDARTRYLAGDSKLQKEYKELDATLKELEMNSLLQKKVGRPYAEWKDWLKPKLTSPAPAAPETPRIPASAQYSKSVDGSLETLNHFDQTFSGSGMADDFNAMSKAAPSSAKKVEIEKRISEQEAALSELEAMKKAHAGNFASSGMKGARDAETRIDIRSRSLRENLTKLKSEQQGLGASIRSADQKVENIAHGDYREYALKTKLQGDHPYDPAFNKKVMEEIEDLKRIKANFKPDDLVSLKKVDVDAEVKRLESFLIQSKSRNGGSSNSGMGGRSLDLGGSGGGLPRGATRPVTLKTPEGGPNGNGPKPDYHEVIWQNLPDGDPLKKTLKALEKKGVKVVESRKDPNSNNHFDGVYLGKRSMLDANGNKTGDFEVIAIDENTFKRTGSLSKILEHEVGHWHTFGNPKNSKDFARALTHGKTELDLPDRLQDYKKFAAADEARQYAKQGMKELRGVTESEIQSRFKNNSELKMNQVFGDDYRKRLSAATHSLESSEGFSKFESKTYAALGKQIDHAPFSPAEIIDQVEADGFFKVPVKNGKDHWEKFVTLNPADHPGMPKNPSEIRVLKDERTKLIDQERVRLAKEYEYTPSDLQDPDVAEYLNRKSEAAAGEILTERHPWMKNFNEKLSQNFKTQATHFERSNQEVKKSLELVRKLEYRSTITKDQYTELRKSLNQGSSSLRSDGN